MSKKRPLTAEKIKFFRKYLNFANSLVYIHTSRMGKRFEEFILNIVIRVCYVLWRYYDLAYLSIPNIAKISLCY